MLTSILGPTVYELSLTRHYVSRWGMAQAVRELIQNALDSESPFVYEFAPGDDGTRSLRLTSEFTTLPPQTLLLGSTSKADDKDAIGSFGEGYKIALLVLTRLGHIVEIHNGDRLWRPLFRHNKRFGEELLTIEETTLPQQNRGLTFFIHGLSEQDVDEIRASCLQMQDHVGQVHSTHYGDILLERPGRLYVGGLFVCETGLKFGYNIKPEHIKLERDRQTIDGWDLKTVTRDMWFATKRYEEIAKLIEAETPDLEHAQWSSPELVKEQCYRLFQEKHPGAVVVSSHTELTKLVEQGMTREKIVQVGGTYYANVHYAPSYQQLPIVRVKSPTQLLEAWFATAKYEMRDKAKASFRELIESSKHWTLK